MSTIGKIVSTVGAFVVIGIIVFQQWQINQLQVKIENMVLDYSIMFQDNDAMHIEFQNQHADHYGFEEDVIVKFLEPHNAVRFKAYMDSINLEYKMELVNKYKQDLEK